MVDIADKPKVIKLSRADRNNLLSDLLGEDIFDPILENRKENKKIEFSAQALLNDYINLIKDGKDREACKELLTNRLMRAVESSIIESNQTDLELQAEKFAYEATKKRGDPFGEIKLSQENKDNYKKKKYNEKLIELSKSDTDPDIKFIRRKIHSDKIAIIEQKYRAPLAKIISKAVDKMAEGDFAFPQAKKARNWFDFAGKIYDGAASIFRQVSLMLGAEKTAVELFDLAAKYSIKLKNELEIEQQKNRNFSSKGAFGDLVEEARKSKYEWVNKKVKTHNDSLFNEERKKNRENELNNIAKDFKEIEPKKDSVLQPIIKSNHSEQAKPTPKDIKNKVKESWIEMVSIKPSKKREDIKR